MCRPFQFLVFLRNSDVILHSCKKLAKLFVIKRKSISEHTLLNFYGKIIKKETKLFCCHCTPLPRQCLIWWVISLSCLLAFLLSVCSQFQRKPRVWSTCSLHYIFQSKSYRSVFLLQFLQRKIKYQNYHAGPAAEIGRYSLNPNENDQGQRGPCCF